MIQTLFDAKRLIADMHNSILKSIESKDTELKRQAIYLLRDAFEYNNFSINHNFSDEIRFESDETFPDDRSTTGKYRHHIYRDLVFDWFYEDEDGYPYIRAQITRHELYHINERMHKDRQSILIYWSETLKRVTRISPLWNVKNF
ncbi:MAG: hypothetical protein E7119_05640 [Bacteroidales bacterium]|nr:hypothetical protein [Bacteroidales bacterium]